MSNQIVGYQSNIANDFNALDALIHSLTPDELQQNYGKDFITYLTTENGGINLNNVKKYVKMIIGNTGLHGNILDFGCGFGTHSILFHLLNSSHNEIVGCDIANGKIDTFSKIILDLKLTNIHAQLIDEMAPLPFPDNSFDIVYCNESLSHVSNIFEGLHEIYRVLKPYGKIVIADTKKWNWWAIYFVYLRGHKDENYFTIHKMRQLLCNTGFRHIHRAKGIVAPRNLLRHKNLELWWLHKYIDPKYVLIGVK